MTAKDSIEDRVAGWNIGVDDYAVKPFAVAELFGKGEGFIKAQLAFFEELISYKNISLNHKLQEGYYEAVPMGLTGERIWTYWIFGLKSWADFEERENKYLIDYGVMNQRAVMELLMCIFIIFVKDVTCWLWPFCQDSTRGVGYMLKGEDQNDIEMK